MNNRVAKLIDRYTKFFGGKLSKKTVMLVKVNTNDKKYLQLSNPSKNKKRHLKKLYKGFTKKQKRLFAQRVKQDIISKANHILEQILKVKKEQEKND